MNKKYFSFNFFEYYNRQNYFTLELMWIMFNTQKHK